MARRLSYDFVKEQFENEGYELLSKEYVNANKNISYKCPVGHVGDMTYSSWYDGHRCYRCGIISRSNKRRHSLSYIRYAFEEEGYVLLNSVYYNNRQLLYYICPKGHRHYTRWAEWVGGHRCAVCGGSMRLTYDFVKRSFENEGYKLISISYRNAMGKLKYICSNNHSGVISWNNWKAGHRCGACSLVEFSGPNNPNWKGGISCDPYCDAWADKEYKESIKERDNYTCLNPDCRKISDRLVIHHIDYNKKNCAPSNLITVCNSCNSRANHNRDWHRGFYQQIMYEKYNYDYLAVKD